MKNLKKINNNTLIVAVLVLLILVGLIQAFQLTTIKSNMKEIGSSTNIKSTSLSSTKSSSSTTGSSGSVPTNLQNLPGMVGGC